MRGQRDMKSDIFRISKKLILAIVLVAIAIVYSVDSLFFRNLFWERLLANSVIALVYLALVVAYLKIKKHKQK